jgi:catechol 2,3-dioxygenase-like lactoylglutathione lyase family enzyme
VVPAAGRYVAAVALTNGVHHLAISTADMKGQLEFFTDVLGAELKALYWMHGVPDTFHGFVKLNDSSYVAFVQGPKNAGIEPIIGVSHAGSAANVSAPGTMQHVAFNVDTLEDLLALRDRIRSRGVNVFGPLDHGMCHSIYFAGPEHLALEIATSAAPIDERAWIDPECVALVGIDAVELAAMKQPAAFESQGGAVPQPPIDPDKPQLVMPPDALRRIMTMPDEVVTAKLSEPDPPVKVAVGR